MIKRPALVLLLCGTSALLFFSVRQYSGFRNFQRYERLRAATPSIRDDFGKLESSLLAAVRMDKNPDYFKALGLLYIDGALAEDKSDEPAQRDAFLDQAASAIAESIRRNPLDSWAYFEMGKAWMLYNAPLLTYADKGRWYLRRALELNPAHDFLNLQTLYYHLSQWDMLDETEKEFAWARLERKWLERRSFIRLLRRQWVKSAKKDDGLRAILMSNEALWRRIAGDFR